MEILYFLAIFLFIFVCLLLCFVILMQDSKSSGLGVSFGSMDSSDSMFGASTPDVLKKITAYLALIFFSSCLILSFWTNALGKPKGTSGKVKEKRVKKK